MADGDKAAAHRASTLVLDEHVEGQDDIGSAETLVIPSVGPDGASGEGPSDGRVESGGSVTTARGRYTLGRKIGSGGFGVVYEAYDHAGNRVALKTMRRELAENPQAAGRFAREIELCRRISDPHAIKIFDDGKAQDGTLFYVMEFLEGSTLDGLLERREKLSFFDIKRILLQVLDALGDAHRHNIIHRDMKPSNIWLTPPADGADPHDYYVKVLDFGIAKSLEPEAAAQKLTQTGTWTGSPAYMSPEHLKCLDLTPAADVFSVGLIAIEMLTGYPAVEGDSSMDMAMSIISADPVIIDDWILESSLGPILEKAVQKDPLGRYPNAGALADALKALNDDRLKNEFTSARIRRRPQMSTSRSRATTVVATSDALTKQHQLRILLGAGIALVMFFIGILVFLKVFLDRHIPVEPQQAPQAVTTVDDLDSRIDRRMKAQVLSKTLGRVATQGQYWGLCDDECIYSHVPRWRDRLGRDGGGAQKPADDGGGGGSAETEQVRAQEQQATVPAKPAAPKPAQPARPQKPKKPADEKKAGNWSVDNFL